VNRDERKQALRDYREREVPVGIYAIRCAASGEAWVGRATDLSKIRNRHWFTLRQGSSPVASLQAAWNAHGDASLTFEVLEELEEEDRGHARDRVLKARQAFWVAELGARAL
jgi:hypothetical protein